MKTTFKVIAQLNICLLTALAPAAWSQPAAPAPAATTNDTPASTSAPKIQFAETTHNFGRIICGQPIKVDFVFTNTGNKTLEITAVAPHCGCTVAGTWDKSVEPGMTGKIPLQVNTANFNGFINKSAAVTCNDPALSNINLVISGTVWKPVEVSPNVVSFNFTTGQPTNDSHSVTIKNNAEEPLSISDLQTGNPAFHAELKTTEPGKQFEVVISTVPEHIPGTVQTTVTCKTSSTNMPVVNITAIANAQPAAAAAPATNSPAKP